VLHQLEHQEWLEDEKREIQEHVSCTGGPLVVLPKS
jgi:hypothetical protein